MYFDLCLCVPLHYARMHVQIQTCMHSHGELARERERQRQGAPRMILFDTRRFFPVRVARSGACEALHL